MMSKEKQSFEEMMKELENIVQKLDNEAVSLEESLDLYQRCLLYTSPSPRD